MTTRMTDSVLVAYLHPNTVSHSFADSMMRLVAHDMANHGRVVSGGTLAARVGPGRMADGRNQMVQQFLDQSGADWMLMVDTDMGFAADTVDRLVEAADPDERPVVGALAFALREIAADGMGGHVVRPLPMLYDWVTNQDGALGLHLRQRYEPDQMTQVAATGTPCLLMHRGMLEKIRANDGDVWFDRVRKSDGTLLSEDISFCYRVAGHGWPMWVHTGIQTTHHKSIWVGEDEFLMFEDAYRRLDEARQSGGGQGGSG